MQLDLSLFHARNNRARLTSDLLAELEASLVRTSRESDAESDVHLYWNHDGTAALVFYGEGAVEQCARARRHLGGRWAKDVTDFRMILQCEGCPITLEVERSAACTPRVVGTETVNFPAVEAQPARTETRDVIEWECHPLLDQSAEPAQTA